MGTEHFIAYHSVLTMGYQIEPSDELLFYSRKHGLLERAAHNDKNTVWVVQGIRTGKSTIFSLLGAYHAKTVEDVHDADPGLYAISGPKKKTFSPPILLNNLEWFPALKKSQSNFSLGFNRINDELTVQALSSLLSSDHPAPCAERPHATPPFRGPKAPGV